MKLQAVTMDELETESMTNSSMDGTMDWEPSNMQPPPPPPEDVQNLQGIVRGLQLYYSPVLALPGLLGNVVCLMMIVRQRKASSGHVYSASLILAESLQLLMLLHDWATEMGADMYRVIGWCHLVTFLQKGSEFLCQWYLVCLVVTTCITSCSSSSNVLGGRHGGHELVGGSNRSSSRRANSDWRPVWKARLLTVAMAVIGLVVFLNISLTADVFYIGDRPVCTTLPTYIPVLYHLDRINVAFNVFVPALIVVASYIGLCIKYLLHKKKGSERSATTNNNAYLTFAMSHSALWLPYQILRVANTLTLLITGNTHLSLRAFLWEQVIRYITYTNMTLNVLLLLTLQPELRKYACGETLDDVCACVCKGHRNKREMRAVQTNEGSTKLSPGSTIEVSIPSDNEA